MESCLNSNVTFEDKVNIEDLKKDLFPELGPDPQDALLGEKEHLQVYLRIRPFTTAESDNGEAQDCVTIEPPNMVLLKAPSSSLSARLSDKSALQTGQRFQFSQVYGPGTGQKGLFEGTVKSLVKDVLDGDNSLVFTYGVTNAGKTFTFLGPEADVGLLPRSLNVIFSSIAERIYTNMSIKPQRCRDFIRLTKEQQADEALGKRRLFRQLKESGAQTSSSSKSTLEGTLEMEAATAEERVSLEVDAHTRFSVWVSFCEIYNENIHDLLEPVPSGALKRTTLRLFQDIRGDPFVKDLRWVQVDSADEAYKVMKLGRKNQSFSSTKLNQLSSRSHSIFSIRILRVDDVGVPRVHSVSELCLCDLAGSERCAKTQNKGDRLKEAGNINTSLLILGKCLNALRHNQQSKLPHHVPFRESKLTHYLQGYFCGRGKACMIVNINQCASLYDETLNVLKFSALAQKVVVLSGRPLPSMAHTSAQDLSFIINAADKKSLLGRRRSSLMGWDSSLEDVQEDGDDECVESTMEETVQESDDEDIGSDGDTVVVDKDTYRRQVALLDHLRDQLKREQAESMALEAQVRGEVTKEFSELFAEMQNDYNERIAKEKEINEDRAERRMEIFKDLVSKSTPTHKEQDVDKSLDLNGMMESMSTDLVGIRQDAEAAYSSLAVTRHEAALTALERRVSELADQLRKAQELLAQKTTELNSTCQQSSMQLEETKKRLESQQLKSSELMEICHEKDEMISRLQSALHKQVEDVSRGKAAVDSIREEILSMKETCTCRAPVGPALRSHSVRTEARKRQGEPQPDLEGQPPRKKDWTAEAGGAKGVELDEQPTEERQGSREEGEQPQEVLNSLRTEPQEVLNSLRAEPQEELNSLRAEPQEALNSLRAELNSLRAEPQEALNSLRVEQQAHQETSAALGDERRAREEALAALEYQTMGKEEALASLEEERRAREETLASLGEQRRSKDEALASLEEERRAREEALASLEEERRARQEALASLDEERRARQEALASLGEQRLSKDEALASLEEERRAREEALASLEEERRARQEALAALGEQSKEEAVVASIAAEKEGRAKAEALSALEEERRRLEGDRRQREQKAQEQADKLQVMGEQVAEQTTRAEQASGDLQAARATLERQADEIHSLTQERQGLRQEIQRLKEMAETTSLGTKADSDHLREEVSVLRKDLSEAQEEKERRDKNIVALEQELGRAKEQLAQKQLTLDQQVQQLTDELRRQEMVSDQQQEELREKLRDQSQRPMEELKEQLKNQELTSVQEVEQLKAMLREQKQTSDKQVEELQRKLREQELASEQQLEEFKRKLTEQQLTSDQQLEVLQQKLTQQEQTSDQQLEVLQQKLTQQEQTSDQQLEVLQQKLTQQEQTSHQLRVALEEVRSEVQSAAIDTASSEAEDNLRKLNSDLQVDAVTLRAKITLMEEERGRALEATEEAGAASARDRLTLVDRAAELERLLKEKEGEMERKLAQKDGELEKMNAEKENNLEGEGDLRRKLSEKEARLASLERSLREAQECREEEECQAVKEARQREVERRRELLAVAEEAIAQKDAELEKRAQEITGLKEAARQDSDRVKSISLDMQRKDDHVSDLREKLADSKKQIQQVQKEIGSMREEERSVKLKLSDLEKTKRLLQSDLAVRDRTIQQLKSEQVPDSRSNELVQKARQDLEAKECVVEEMRLALTEQDETQAQLEQVVEDLTEEVEKLQGLLQERDGGNDPPRPTDSLSEDLRQARLEVAKVQESWKLSTEKHQADRRKWLEEKMSLISQAKESEDKRNQEMRRFADNRERHAKQQSQMESLSAQLCEKEQAMERWRQERDSLVSALEVQLQRLVSSNADKEQLIQQLRCGNASQPAPESGAGRVEELQTTLSKRDSEIQSLKEQLKASAANASGTKRSETATQTKADEAPAEVGGKPQSEASNLKPRGRWDARGSASSQGSCGYPTVLDSSEISTENGRTSRFPKPELEISFSPLQPNRMALRRQGDDTAVTVKINRSARKRRSGEMDKILSFSIRKAKHRATREDEVTTENRRNTRTRLTPKLTAHQEEGCSPGTRQEAPGSRREGALQKIGDFLQSSPTLLGSKAKKMMGLVSGRAEGSEGGSLSLKARKSKKKLYRPDISSPMDMPSHPIIGQESEDKDSDHTIMKRRLRSKIVK